MTDVSIWGIVGISALTLVFILIQILYLLSLYTAMKAVPESKRVFPAWFIWMILIPLVGFIFAWIMEPFGIPKSFEAMAGDNQAMRAEAKTIYGIGLAHMILMTIAIIPFVGWLSFIAGLVLWIIYWAKVASFKNTFLQQPLVTENKNA